MSNCSTCRQDPQYKKYILPRCFQSTKCCHIIQNKEGIMELFASPMFHKKEIRLLGQNRDGFHFWFWMMKFINDQLFVGKCPNKPPKNINKVVELDIDYGSWLKQEHAYVIIRPENFKETIEHL